MTKPCGSAASSSFALVRLAGLATVFLGVAIAYTGLLRAGGWPAVGADRCLMGLIDAVFAPRILKKQWEREDRGE